MPQGSRPGERRGGRKKGTPNKVTAEVKSYAHQFTNEAIDVLVSIMQNAEAPPQARVAAANSVLDRSLGKPAQAIDAGPELRKLLVAWQEP